MHALAWKRFMSPNLLGACPCTQYLQLGSDGLPHAPVRGGAWVHVRYRTPVQAHDQPNKKSRPTFVRRCAAHISYPDLFSSYCRRSPVRGTGKPACSISLGSWMVLVLSMAQRYGVHGRLHGHRITRRAVMKAFSHSSLAVGTLQLSSQVGQL
jgi:hypothetical protein